MGSHCSGRQPTGPRGRFALRTFHPRCPRRCRGLVQSLLCRSFHALRRPCSRRAGRRYRSFRLGGRSISLDSELITSALFLGEGFPPARGHRQPLPQGEIVLEVEAGQSANTRLLALSGGTRSRSSSQLTDRRCRFGGFRPTKRLVAGYGTGDRPRDRPSQYARPPTSAGFPDYRLHGPHPGGRLPRGRRAPTQSIPAQFDHGGHHHSPQQPRLSYFHFGSIKQFEGTDRRQVPELWNRHSHRRSNRTGQFLENVRSGET